jgi:3'(2'), 5'-bisphosphate nucleotidase
MLDLELRVACRLARDAGSAIEAIRTKGFEALLKSDRTPVTEADLAADQLLHHGLLEAFPRDSLLSEESEPHQGPSERTWIIDPLDGTRGFIRGAEGYAVQIGLVVGDTALLGVVYEPQHRRLYYAIRQRGAYLECKGVTRRLKVSSREDFSSMTMVTSSSLAHDTRQRLAAQLGLADGLAMHSVGCKAGMIVRQEADIYVSSHPVKYWDSCGPLVIVEEAGGTWTHLDGAPFTYALGAEIPVHGGPFVVTNGHEHITICQAVMRNLEDATLPP